MSKIRSEINKFSSDADKPILEWLFERYHWASQWRFVARFSEQRYGVLSYEINRVWEPTIEGRALYDQLAKKNRYREDIEMNWTKPYYGITHFGELRDEFRCTVCDYGTFANLSLYRKGCPRISETVYATVEDAKLIGERWVKSGGTK